MSRLRRRRASVRGFMAQAPIWTSRPRSRKSAARVSSRSGGGGARASSAYSRPRRRALGAPGPVVGEEAHPADARQAGHQGGRRREVSLAVRVTGDDRHADPDVGVDRGERPQVVEDRRGREAGEGEVARVVHELHVEEEEVHERGEGEEALAGREAAGVDRGVQGGGAARLEERLQEVGLGEGLAAGERDAAPGLLVEDAVAEDLLHDLVHRRLAAGQLARAGRARLDAGAAGGAERGPGRGRAVRRRRSSRCHRRRSASRRPAPPARTTGSPGCGTRGSGRGSP